MVQCREPSALRRALGGWLPLSLVVVLYFVLSFRNITLPGVNMDETLHAPEAVNMLVANMPGDYVTKWSGWAVEAGGYRFPVAAHSYSGSLKSYVLALSFALLGVNVVAMRLATVLLGAAAVALTYVFARRLFGVGAAVVAGALLATDPSFIMYMRVDYGPIAMPMLLKGLSLLPLAAILVRPERKPGRSTVIAMGFLLGIGIYDRVYFAWFVLAMLAGLLVLTLVKRLQLTLTHYAWMGIAIGMGILPLVLYNSARGFPTLQLLLAGGPSVEQARVPPGEISPGWILQNMRPRSVVLWQLLRGDIHAHYLFRQPLPRAYGLVGTLFPYAMCLAAIWLLVALIRRRGTRSERTALAFLLITMGLSLALVYATPSADRGHHFAVVYPIPHLLVGLALSSGLSAWPGRISRRLTTILAAAAGGVLIASNLVVGGEYHRFMLELSPRQIFSPAIYTVADELQGRYHGCVVQVMAWGPGNPLMLLSRGTLVVHQPFWGLGDPATPAAREWFAQELRDSRNVFVMYAADYTPGLALRTAFFDEVAKQGLIAHDEPVFDVHGEQVFSIVSVQTPGSLYCGMQQ